MASLYDDLDVIGNKTGGIKKNPNEAESKPSNSNKSGMDMGFKLMQSHMAARRAQSKNNTLGLNKSGYAPPPNVKADKTQAKSEGNYIFNQKTGRMERFTKRSINMKGRGDTQNLPLGIPNEYNPLIPNEYEEVVKLNIERKKINGALRNDSDGSDLSTGDEDDDDYSDPRETVQGYRRKNKREDPQKNKAKCAAIAPPPSLINLDTPNNPPPSGAGGSDAMDSLPPPSVPQVNSVFNMNKTETEESQQQKNNPSFGYNPVAAKMMAKMGYREGQGLGKGGQGMSTALTVEKTGRRAGKIIHEKDRQPGQVEILTNVALVDDFEQGEETEQEQSGNFAVPRDPVVIPNVRSKVILLQNMCGPGEVDDDLEPETAEECAKYGKVKSCMIYELPDAPDIEAIRIFVEFEDEESATRAILDLNGRFFGGRVVRAGFYEEKKFHNLELTDKIIT